MSELQQEVRLSGGDEPMLDNYRPISKLAVLAVLLAVASPLALVTPLLWVIPFAALLTSVFALVVISRPGSGVIGRKAVLAAVATSCFFGAWAPARYLSWQAAVDRQSAALIDKWLELIRTDQLDAAYQMHVDSRGGAPAEGLSPPGMESPPEPAGSAGERFFQTPPHDAMRNALKTGAYRHAGLAEIRWFPPYQQIVQGYVFQNGETGEEATLLIAVQLALHPYEGERRWSIFSVETERQPSR